MQKFQKEILNEVGGQKVSQINKKSDETMIQANI